ncbi:MAG: monofunctional biosynthetic peptidoglycan transglycosylase [Methylococcales bacterium]
MSRSIKNPIIWNKILTKGRRLVWLAAFFSILTPILLVVPLRWFNPPITSFMLIRQIDAWWSSPDDFQIHYEWLYWNQISPELLLAVIAAEDQKYPYHHGFDTESIQAALFKWQETGKLRGASTITQQVAKNIYLWNGRSFVRKSLEAYFTMLLEIALDKKRILELYANIAEFGDGIYGAQAAAMRYFGMSARRLTRVQASRLAAVLPNPDKFHADRPSRYVERRSRWIRAQMAQLGGILYLQEI